MKYLILLLLVIANSANAQKQKIQYYLYDKDWNTVTKFDAAAYVVQAATIGDSLFVNRIFKGRGYLWRQESFKDPEQTIPYGQFAWYDDKGRIDSSGFISNKRKTGYWSYYDDKENIYFSVNYDNGVELERRYYQS